MNDASAIAEKSLTTAQQSVDALDAATTARPRAHRTPPRPSTDPFADQLPPHDFAAEAGVIGSMVIDPEVVGPIRMILTKPEMFYKEAHQVLFRVLCDFADENKRVDGLILVSRLRHLGSLEDIGGTEYLHEVLESVPSSANAEYYAGIVRERYRLRKLLSSAYATIRDCQDSIDSAVDIEDRAESRFFELSQEKIAESFTPLVTVVQDTLEDLDKYQGQVRGLMTGYRQLDDMTGGLQNGDFVILAARPSHGKSALALNLAEWISIDRGHPVAFFSLEMSKLSLGKRLLSARSGFSLQRLWQNNFNSAERETLHRVIGELSAGNIFIADGVSRLNDIRQMSRRMMMENGIRLVVIDYLQLIESTREENRQQQVSTISRQLKALARELNVPVLVLAQLNRGNETEKREPRTSDMRESGCLSGDTRVIDAITGIPTRIDRIKDGDKIIVTNEMTTCTAMVSKAWCTGEKLIYELTTRTGRTIKATANHRFLTDRGWVALGDLKDDDLLATAFRLPNYGVERPERAELCRLLGYMIGNGSYQKHRSLGLIIPDNEAFSDACNIIRHHWPEVEIKLRNNNYNDAWISRTFENGYGRPGGNPMLEWFRSLGMVGERDHTKSVPNFVFESGRVGATEFLRGYMAADGCVAKCGNRFNVRFDTTSHRLAQDVAHLLSVIGVACVITNGRHGKLSRRGIYRIAISMHPDNVAAFSAQVRPIGYRGERLDSASQLSCCTKSRSTIFNLPKSATLRASEVSKWRDQKKCISRSSVATLAEQTGDELLTKYANTDFIWERMRSLKTVGKELVYDLCVPGFHNFIANGIVVHNSLEQDADVVMLLHRESMMHTGNTDWMNNNQDIRDLTKLIIAKQRNGPTGHIYLKFISELTKLVEWDGVSIA